MQQFVAGNEDFFSPPYNKMARSFPQNISVSRAYRFPFIQLFPPCICKITWLCSGFCSPDVAHNVVVVTAHDGFLHRFNPACQKGQKFRRLHRALGEWDGLGRQGQIQMPSPFHQASLQFQLRLYVTR